MNTVLFMNENSVPYERFEISSKNMKGNNKMKGLTQEQLLKYKSEQDKKDSLILSDLHLQAKQITQGQKLISAVLEQQEPLIENVNKGFDRLDQKINRENNKLKLYLENSNSNCLFWTMIAELVLLFVFFML